MDIYIIYYFWFVILEQLLFKVNEFVVIIIENFLIMLFCILWNVKFILCKLEVVGFICWQLGIGRGYYFKLIFLKSMDEVMEDYFFGLISNGKMKEVVEFIGLLEFWDLNGVIRQRLLCLLNQQMGFYSYMEISLGQDVF